MGKRLLGIVLALMLLILPAMAQDTVQEPYALEPTSEVWHTYDPKLHYYYNQLSEQEKRLFSARYDALAIGNDALWNYQIGSFDTLGRARVNFVLNMDCPELMFYGGDYASFSLMQRPNEAYFEANPPKIERFNEECLNAVQQIVDDAMSPYEKELAIDRYLKSNCAYAFDATRTDWEYARTAHSALVEGRAICTGYSLGAAYALRVAGIPCIVLEGNVKPEFSYNNYTGHIWLMVEINDAWYHYDPTWDDQDGVDNLEDYYPFLNLSTAEIRATRNFDHVQNQYRFDLPQALSMDENHYVKSGKMLDGIWATEMVLLARSARASGNNAVGMIFTDAEDYGKFVQNIRDKNYFPLTMLTFEVGYLTIDASRFVYLWW